VDQSYEKLKSITESRRRGTSDVSSHPLQMGGG